MNRRHIIFYISASAGLVALCGGLWLIPDIGFTIGANVFFALYVGLMLRQMPHLTADYLSKYAGEADEPMEVIFLVTVATVAVAVGSLFLLINAGQRPGTVHLVFALTSVPLGWLTIHTMSALHYAHTYWQGDSEAKNEGKTRKPQGGVAFPGTDKPQGWDFLYFSMVIGMTAQTADTNVTNTRMRRMVLLHGVFSFFFNTVIVAAAVNLVVSLAP